MKLKKVSVKRQDQGQMTGVVISVACVEGMRMHMHDRVTKVRFVPFNEDDNYLLS